MNLAMGSGGWLLIEPGSGKPWASMPPERVAADGSLKSLAANEDAAISLQIPEPSSSGALFRCTWKGTGTLRVAGQATNTQNGDHNITFRWTYQFPDALTWVHVYLEDTSPTDPIRDIDCREAAASPTQLYSTEFTNYLAPFGVIRFLDWQLTNNNKGGDWDQRTPPTAFHPGPDGVSVEHMVALANQLNADAWFLMPYNADENYIRRFAQYVHDHMPANRKVYVELGNELWNSLFPAAQQAEQEGLAMNLDSRPFEARMKRYAQKSDFAMRIWTEVFADRPSSLVRTIGVQSGSVWLTDNFMTSWSDADLYDAVATAPYFGWHLFEDQARESWSMNDIMMFLSNHADERIEAAKQVKAAAAKYGKRNIAYEAGQHIVSPNNDLMKAVQRYPGMYDVYKRYLERWQNEVGDLMTLYNSTGPISQYGAWGLREYHGQPLSAAPKLRAALDVANAQIEAQPEED